MTLTPNPHFDHLPVNTSLSTVLIPPNVEDYGKRNTQLRKKNTNIVSPDAEVTNAIQWSEHLDPLLYTITKTIHRSRGSFLEAPPVF